jgi:hypothetical protein
MALEEGGGGGPWVIYPEGPAGWEVDPCKSDLSDMLTLKSGMHMGMPPSANMLSGYMTDPAGRGHLLESIV